MDRERYRELFLAEAKEHLAAAFEMHGRLEAGTGDEATWKDLLRRAHSLKGMAATMGYGSLVELAHAMEDFLAGHAAPLPGETRPELSLLADGLACMTRIVERVERDESTDSDSAQRLALAFAGSRAVAAPTGHAAAARDTDSEEGRSVATATDWRIDLMLDVRPARSAELTVEILSQLAALGRVVQVDPPRLDLQTGCFEGRLGLILRTDLGRERLNGELLRLSGLQGCSLDEAAMAPAAPVKSDPQRWVRVRAEQLDLLVEGLQELRLQQAGVRASLPESCRAALNHMERAELRLEEIYGNVLELRLIPFDTVAQRLHQAVRELAVQLGKEVHLEIAGEQVRLDRSLLDALVDPLLHMVRNAMDHGLEPPGERRAAGKPERCELVLELERRGERVHVRLRDDGRGMDPDTIRLRAVQCGFVNRDEADEMSHDQVLMLTTQTGFTTADTVTHLSGRGIGLDVVRETVERLGGTLSIRSKPARGTRVTIEVPLRMALIQSLLVRSAGELYAVPMEAVEQTLAPVGERPDGTDALRDELASNLVRIPSPASATHTPCEEAERVRWIVVLDAGDSRVNLEVDEVVGRREMVVKPLQPPLSQLRPFAGVVLLENGAIALVVDPLQLAR